MTDADAQQKLNDGVCPQCGAEILERGEPDDIDGSVYWHAWFECEGKDHHIYTSEYDRETRDRYALWEGYDEPDDSREPIAPGDYRYYDPANAEVST